MEAHSLVRRIELTNYDKWENMGIKPLVSTKSGTCWNSNEFIRFIFLEIYSSEISYNIWSNRGSICWKSDLINYKILLHSYKQGISVVSPELSTRACNESKIEKERLNGVSHIKFIKSDCELTISFSTVHWYCILHPPQQRTFQYVYDSINFYSRWVEVGRIGPLWDGIAKELRRMGMSMA